MRVSDESLRVRLPEGGETELAYRAWGDIAHPRLILMVHGLTRNGRDFDALAQAMAEEAFVVCPDMPGRGRSAALPDPTLYNYPVYLSALGQLMAQYPRPQIQWVGTSMGGILGMMSAATNPGWVQSLVLNDVGARIPAEGMRRIAAYASKPQHFANRAAALAYLRITFASFGFASDQEWNDFADISLKREELKSGEGGFRLNYDPALTLPLAAYLGTEAAKDDIDLSDFWAKVTCPILLLRGEVSDILPADVAEEMGKRRECTLVEVSGVGHAPALVAADQIDAVRGWLNLHWR